MGVATALIVGAGVAAAGAAVAKGMAARKAANARKNALNAMERIDVESIQAIARRADRERFEGALDLQRKVDPTAAGIREGGLENLLAAVSGERAGRMDAASEDLLFSLLAENRLPDEDTQAIKRKLLSDARAELEAGASLSPEFQAELVRAGLQTTSGAGILPEPRGAAGQTLRRLTGSAGLALQEQRRQSAQRAVGVAAAIDTNRQTTLQTLAQQFQGLLNTRVGRAGAAIEAGQSLLPDYGLAGREAANLELARIQQNNNILAGIADTKAQKATATGELITGVLGAATSAAGGAYGYNTGGNFMASFNAAQGRQNS